MKRMSEVSLTNLAVAYATEYVEKKFICLGSNGGDIVARQQIVNYLAHGYYMGARRLETIMNRRWYQFRIPRRASLDPNFLEPESIAASDAYFRKNPCRGMGLADRAFVRATLTTGFNSGFVSRGSFDEYGGSL